MEHLKFHDLLEASQTNRFLSMLTLDVFRRKFTSKTMSIVSSIASHDPPVYETESRIFLQSNGISMATIKSFGSQIKRLHIDFGSMCSKERGEILQLINKHCSQSLQSINFDQCDENTFNHLLTPFSQVEQLIVSDSIQTIDGGLKLNDIFPKLCHLDLAGVEVLAPNTLNVKFTYLVKLDVTISLLNNIYPHIEKLIRLNPQIRDLSLIYCNSFDYIRLASDHLKHLESLQLNLEILDKHHRDPKIHFATVKHLKMTWGLYDFSHVLSFNHLESLDLNCLNGIEFVAQFTNLTQLNLIQNKIRNQDIMKVSEKLINLNQLTISTESVIQKHSIFHLIEGSHNLKKLQLKSHFGHIYQALKQRFDGEWTMAQRNTLVSMQKIDQEMIQYVND